MTSPRPFKSGTFVHRVGPFFFLDLLRTLKHIDGDRKKMFYRLLTGSLINMIGGEIWK